MASEPSPPGIDELKAGSEAAWNDAVRLIGPPLRGFIGLRGADDPDGVLGDVFFDLARSIDRCEGGWAGFRTLAFVIARRRLIDEQRRRRRRPSVPMDGRVLDLVRDGDVEQEALDRIERRQLLDLLDLLTPLQRDVLTLRFVAGLDIREVAAVTGSTDTAVKANQRRAIASLRRHVARSGEFERSPAAQRMVEIIGGAS